MWREALAQYRFFSSAFFEILSPSFSRSRPNPEAVLHPAEKVVNTISTTMRRNFISSPRSKKEYCVCFGAACVKFTKRGYAGRERPHLPADAPRAACGFAVLGTKVTKELFGSEIPLGAQVRIGTERYLVFGVMALKGQVLGFDLDHTVFIHGVHYLPRIENIRRYRLGETFVIRSNILRNELVSTGVTSAGALRVQKVRSCSTFQRPLCHEFRVHFDRLEVAVHGLLVPRACRDSSGRLPVQKRIPLCALA
jgi:hypothetical protein